jgi:hypothetical protein
MSVGRALPMQTEKKECLVWGRVTPEGSLELDDKVPLPPGRVLVAVASEAKVNDSSARRRKTEADQLIGCITDEEAREMMEAIAEGDQIEPLEDLAPLYVVNGKVDATEEELDRRRALMDEAIGCLSDEEAEEMLQIIEEEFGQVDPREWD